MDNFKTLKRSYIPVFKDKKLVFYTFLNMVSGGLLPILSIYIITKISENIINMRLEFIEILKLISLYCIISFILTVIDKLTYATTYVKYNLLRSLVFTDIVKKIITMDFKYYEDPKMMDEISLSFEGVANNNRGIEGVYHKGVTLAKNIFTAIILSIILAKSSFLIILILIINIFLEFKITNIVNEYKFSKRKERNNISRKSSYYAMTASDFKFGKDMRIYSMKDKFKSYFYNEVNRYKELLEDIFKKEKTYFFIQTFFIVIADAISLYILINLVGVKINLSEFIKYLTTVTILTNLLREIFLDLSNVRENLLYTSQTFNFLDSDLITQGGKDIDFKGEAIELEFENVTFRYPGGNKNVVENLSFKIEKGKSLALVGLNGAGKTTLVKLITGLYNPDSGDIYYNGINSKKLSQESKFKMFSVVFQDINPLAYSVKENISASLENIDDEKVIQSLKKVGLYEKINSLPKGINTSIYKVIDEDGITLSGGENQKLIMARSLYKDNTSMLILDEPTASLDALAEEKIYKEFESLMDKRTTLFISHRLASTKFCDEIMLLNDGKVLETGTHDELIKLDGFYKKMYDTQGKYYKEEK